MAAQDEGLTSAQLHALFDILTHYEVYREIEDFKDPATAADYGFPFVRADGSHAAESSAPLLQRLVTTFILPFPGVGNMPATFWHVVVQGIIEKFAAANLSESYDKGAMGTRKTLTTVSSSAIEVVVRGVLGGCPRHVRINGCLRQNRYDPASAASIVKAWDDVVQELVYGKLIDELFDVVEKEGNLEKHSPAVETAVEYIIIHLSTILHQVFVVSPEGQYIIKLVENIHKLLPYSMIRQTLRVGNAATMISGMTKLLLAKLSIGAVSNWFGVTENADDGMNTLQRIVSMILSWDCTDFKKTADKIKKSKGGPSKEHLAAIEEHIKLPRAEQEAVRLASVERQQSIIVAILNAADPSLVESLTEATHTSCLEYYSARLSVRDRDEIGKVLCRMSPDLPTQALRDAVSAFDPIIREIHSKVPLHEHMADLESFITELVETSRGKKTVDPSGLPSVKDYVELLRKHRYSLYKWLARLGQECPELREDFRTWCKTSIKEFRREASVGTDAHEKGEEWAAKALKALMLEAEKAGSPKKERSRERHAHHSGAAGTMSPAVSAIFDSLPEEKRLELVALLDRHTAYLAALHKRTMAEMQGVLDQLKDAADDEKQKTNGAKINVGASGPGIYLVRWQDLLDETVITSASPAGPPRRGRDVKFQTTQGKAVTGGKAKESLFENGLDGALDSVREEQQQKEEEKQEERAPDVRPVVEAVGPRFRELLVKAGAS